MSLSVLRRSSPVINFQTKSKYVSCPLRLTPVLNVAVPRPLNDHLEPDFYLILNHHYIMRTTSVINFHSDLIAPSMLRLFHIAPSRLRKACAGLGNKAKLKNIFPISLASNFGEGVRDNYILNQYKSEWTTDMF